MPGLHTGGDGVDRCWWCGDDPLYVAYHDREWGRPVHDEQRLFEKVCLEGFQAGLAWITVLRKREAFREAFAGFDPRTVAAFEDEVIGQLLNNSGIIRHRGKIAATLNNARALLAMHERGETLDSVVWAHAPTGHQQPSDLSQIPGFTVESTALSKALRKRGFNFVGPTTMYAFMQSMGVVNDHVVGCFSG